MLLHELEDFSELIEVTAGNLNIDPGLIEKDYWIMHGLWGLQQLGVSFELKGGTSLSKGHQLIDRFSEDIDILIHPDGDLPTKPNQNSAKQVAAFVIPTDEEQMIDWHPSALLEPRSRPEAIIQTVRI